jgi:hypothetical protein
LFGTLRKDAEKRDKYRIQLPDLSSSTVKKFDATDYIHDDLANI